ncbi:MAG: protein kinase [Actinomycetota bacterium]|nr:protein kinase [Actinomycetota bacterium]
MGGYRIEAVAGRGGMGTVYRVTQLGLGRILALKVIAPNFAADPAFRERFRRESTLAASLDHPNVITVYEAGEDNAGRLFVSMRLVDGPDLRRLVNDEGPLVPGRAVELVAQVAAALDAAHAAGLVHRDVKPANVLIEARAGVEHAYLSDFGLVKRLGGDAGLTGSAGWLGSVDYVAPEQVSGGPVDARTDVYALGALLYTALTATVPYPRADTAAKLYAAVNEVIAPMHPRVPGVPAGLDAVIARATAKDPAARFSTAGEMADAARAALVATTPAPAATTTTPAPAATEPYPGTPQPTSPARPGRRWKRTGLAIATAVALIGGGTAAAVALSGGGSGRQPPIVAANRSARPAPAPAVSRHPGSTPAATGPHGSLTVDSVTESGYAPDQYRLTLYDLRRAGPFVTLDFGIVCAQSSGSCVSEFDFGTPEGKDGPPVHAAYNTASGVALIDPTQKKEYREVEDSQQRPECSDIGPSIDVGPTVHLASATFPAPPASVSTMDVIFPNGGARVQQVPLTTDGPPDLSRVASSVIPATPAAFAKPIDPTSTAGLTLPVEDLVSTAGNPSASDAEAPGHTTITLNANVVFDFDQADLTPAAGAILTGVGTKIKAGGNGAVAVTGFTDSIGLDAVNTPLSHARAQAVVAALTPQVTGAPVTFQATGMGAADPVAPNTNPDGSDDPAGRALNRRVTVSYNAIATPPPAASTPAPARNSVPAPPEAPPVDYTTTGGSHYRIAVDRLVRDGSFAVLNLSVTCVGKGTDINGCDGSYDFASGSTTVPPVSDSVDNSGPSNTAGAFYLTDPVGQQEYLVVHDSFRNPLSADTHPTWNVGDTYPLWLYFPDPPSSLSSVTLDLPDGAEQISNVPIT